MAFDTAQLSSYSFADNVSRAFLPGETRTLVEQAEAVADVIALPDGTPTLRCGTRVLGREFDAEALLKVVQRAGSQPRFVVFGIGMGHTVRALRALCPGPISIFEPDPGLLRTYLESGPSDLLEIPIVCTLHDLTQHWPRLFHGKQTITLVKTPGYSELYPEQASALHEAMVELVQRSAVNDATHRMRARVWIQDVLANLELLAEHPTFLALADQYIGVPAFIVGAGPSLGKNGKQLADAAKKGLVIATNSSARALDRYGVEPQVVACMESLDVSPLFRDVSYIDRVVRAVSLTGHPNTLRTGGGPLLHVFEGIDEQNAPLSALLGFPGIAVSGSVSTLAFSLALRLGCSPIVFVGQDLAYTDGQAYAAGTPYEHSRVRLSEDGEHLEHEWCETLKTAHNQGSNRMIEREPLRQVPAWGGRGQVRSTIGFSAVRAWLESSSVALARERPELRLINATEGGARLAGFEECTLSEVLASLPERAISAASLAAHARRVQAPLSYQQLAGWCAEQAALARAVRHAARRIRRLGDACRVAMDKEQHRKVQRCFERLEMAELALKDRVERMPFLNAWSHAEIGDAVQASAALKSSNDDRDSAVRSVALEQAIGLVIEQGATELEREFEALSHRFRPLAEVHAPPSPTL